MAQTPRSHGEHPSDHGLSTGTQPSDCGLDSLSDVGGAAWRQNPSRTRRLVSQTRQCANDLPRLEKDWIYAKKKTYGYRERDDVKRAEFLEKLSKIEPSRRVYVDESGMDHRDDYGYGWCEAGQRFEALKSGRREGRINMIAAYCGADLLAPFTVNGACNRTVFETWIETCLVPKLRRNQVVILDNATFHHGGRIAALIEAAGCQLLYLPPYSPDFNRIEKCWAWLKSRVRKRLNREPSLRDAIESVLKEATA